MSWFKSLPVAAALLALSALAMAPAPAIAAGDSAPKSGPEADAARQLDTPNLAIPVVRNGQLRSYLYVLVRVKTPVGVDAFALRDKGHILRDALLRASHKVDLVDPANDDQLNVTLAQRTFAQVAQTVLGAQAVGEVQLLDLTSLRRSRR